MIQLGQGKVAIVTRSFGSGWFVGWFGRASARSIPVPVTSCPSQQENLKNNVSTMHEHR